VKIGVPKEVRPAEKRVPLIPADVERLVKRGADITVEAGMGEPSRHLDEAYTAAGATVTTDRKALLSQSDLVLRLNKPPLEEVPLLKPGAFHMSYLDPFNEQELIQSLIDHNIGAISVEMIPRSTIAQKMDALSSQANLAGYVAVIVAAEQIDKVLPMMTTPAGTISPARVFVIGAGVAGLQAIATARRLGARVEAFDTRPVVAEQVRSLGAKFAEIDLGDTGETKQGYAKQLTQEQLDKQRREMTKFCARSDIVISTAQVFGRKAPLIVTADMITAMKPGSVVVDLAIETGGNVAGAKLGEVVDINGVKIVGLANLPGRVAIHASQMYSSNLRNFLEHFWDDEKKAPDLDPKHEIVDGCLITQNKTLRNQMLRDRYAQSD
jgi:NAD(P) transhydrogenase subunit alpha